MANIDDYLVASYRCNGKGNSDADRDVLKDLTGNGHDLQLKNFAFSGSSGYGLYEVSSPTGWWYYGITKVNLTKYSVQLTDRSHTNQDLLIFFEHGSNKLTAGTYNFTRFRFKITNPNNHPLSAFFRGDKSLWNIDVTESGIYEFPDITLTLEEDANINYGFELTTDKEIENFSMIFELLPKYEGALVFDGVDDYGICEDFPALKDFTFVYKRINLNPSKSTNCFLSKSVSTNQAQQFCSELAYSQNIYVRLGGKDIAVKDIYNPELSIVYVTKESYNGEMDLVSSNYTSTVDNLYIGTFSRGVQAYVWNGALYALDIYDRTLSDEYLQKALNRMNDIDINWKDGVGEVTDQHLTVSPGSGTGNAAVSFGSVMNKGLDRTLELEITTPKGVKKTLTVNQEGCRQAYITSDGKRWLTSDNRVYGVLKSDAPCECTGDCP